MAGAHLGRLSGRRKEWTQTQRQEVVDGYVGSHQDGSPPSQLLQASPLQASPLQALLTWQLSAQGHLWAVTWGAGGLQEEVEATTWSKAPVSLPGSDFPGMDSPANLCPSQPSMPSGHLSFMRDCKKTARLRGDRAGH